MVCCLSSYQEGWDTYKRPALESSVFIHPPPTHREFTKMSEIKDLQASEGYDSKDLPTDEVTVSASQAVPVELAEDAHR